MILLIRVKTVTSRKGIILSLIVSLGVGAGLLCLPVPHKASAVHTADLLRGSTGRPEASHACLQRATALTAGRTGAQIPDDTNGASPSGPVVSRVQSIGAEGASIAETRLLRLTDPLSFRTIPAELYTLYRSYLS